MDFNIDGQMAEDDTRCYASIFHVNTHKDLTSVYSVFNEKDKLAGTFVKLLSAAKVTGQVCCCNYNNSPLRSPPNNELN